MMEILVGVVAMIAGVCFVFYAQRSESGFDLFIGIILVVSGLLAVFSPGGDSWQSNDAVVYQVTTDPEHDAFVITTEGDVLHCTVAKECEAFVRGYHVTFQQRDNGTFVPGHPGAISDIKLVAKG